MNLTATAPPTTVPSVARIDGKDKLADDSQALLNRPDVMAVSSDDGVVIGYTNDGKPVDANGKQADPHRSLLQRTKAWFLPDPENVTKDYLPYRIWKAAANVTNGAIAFIAAQGVVVGLAAASSISIPVVGALLGAGTLAYLGKDLLNPLGTLKGGSDARKVDDDPAACVSRSMITNTVSNALQSLLLAIPGAYFVLAPTTNMGESYANSLQSSSDQVILNHQALRGTGAIAGKNTKQDLVSSGIGMALGVGASAALSLVAPWAPLLMIAPLLAGNVLASRKAARSLEFDNLTNGVVRSLVHTELTEGGDIPTPGELKKEGRKLPKHQRGLEVGADVSELAGDPNRFKQVADHFQGSYMMDVGKKDIKILLREQASEQDLVQAVFQGQVLSEILDCPGYKKLEGTLGEKAASLKAIDLSSGFVQNFGATLQAIEDKGWDFSRTHIVAEGNRADWKSDPKVPPAPAVSLDDLRKFWQDGNLPRAYAGQGTPS